MAKKDDVVKFKSKNPFLYVHHINVQFKSGVYETSNEVEINALRIIEDVEEVI